MEISSSQSDGRTESLSIRNRRQELSKVGDWLESTAKAWKMEKAARYNLDLVLTELLVNIIQYGYGEDETGRIEISLQELPAQFRLKVSDEGKPFNPLEVEVSEIDGDLDDAWQSGRGLLLVRNLSSSLDYAYRNGYNQLTLTVSRDSSSADP